jgi:hypothetical protein
VKLKELGGSPKRVLVEAQILKNIEAVDRYAAKKT